VSAIVEHFQPESPRCYLYQESLLIAFGPSSRILGFWLHRSHHKGVPHDQILSLSCSRYPTGKRSLRRFGVHRNGSIIWECALMRDPFQRQRRGLIPASANGPGPKRKAGKGCRPGSSQLDRAWIITKRNKIAELNRAVGAFCIYCGLTWACASLRPRLV